MGMCFSEGSVAVRWPGGPEMRGLMGGGGLNGAFVGGGDSRGHGWSADRLLAASTPRASSPRRPNDVTCGPTTKDGLTVLRVSTFKSARWCRAD
jgi:hypothetical protein